jgi:hypothetical protein
MTEDLRKQLQEAAQGNRYLITAETYLKEWSSASKPVLLRCNDAQTYVVKGSQNQKMIVNEHVVGRLGELLGAPVAEVEFVDIPQELRQIEPKLSHIGPSIAHGTRFIPDCTERTGIDHANLKENHDRFALLTVLYSWVQANDHQCIYGKSPPHLVYSVDHGHFFQGGPNWTVHSLTSNHNVQIDPWFSQCGLSLESMYSARERLLTVLDEDIQLIAMGPPDAWGISQSERAALIDYLIKRKAKLLEILPKSQ